MNDIVEATGATSHQSVGYVVLARKSWVVYVGRLIIAIAILLIVPPLLWSSAPLVAAGMVLLIILGMAYEVAVERSYVLFMDDAGIWLRRGILPWSKGVNGVKWRDLDSAVYITGFVSWLTRSYTVRLEHRFTKANEILISHMAAGDQAVKVINAAHIEMIRRAGS
ncbi:conserved hypothetical protein [Burkholderia diffusa]|uniref:hypothetical protein n=1 Tax=Burkholderia diffusa TaxID=488732 RepID=UPI001CAC6FE9|nr:hypothetical protein [Burkholderia diffusa]CAG9253995.1 conserved hypothetical protein [Burkholderia diffusa]